MTDYLAGGAEFLYPHAGDPPAPENTKVLLLTRGGVCVTGHWHRDWCLGWLPLPRRNMAKEDGVFARQVPGSGLPLSSEESLSNRWLIGTMFILFLIAVCMAPDFMR